MMRESLVEVANDAAAAAVWFLRAPVGSNRGRAVSLAS